MSTQTASELAMEWDDNFDLDSFPREPRKSSSSTSGASMPGSDPVENLASVTEVHSRISALGSGLFDAMPSIRLTRRRSHRAVRGVHAWKPWASQWCGLRDLLSIREQWVQVVTAAFLGCCAIYSDCVVQVYLQQNIVGSGSDKMPLTDIGFKYFGYWHSPHAADVSLGGFILLTVLRFIIFPGPYAMRWTILRRWLLCMGLLFLLRGMSIIATVLPNPDKACESSIHAKGAGDENDWNIFILAWCVMSGQCVTCADVLYSGHTVNFTLAALIWYRYSPICPYSHRRATWLDKLQLQRVFALTYVVCGYIIIIKTHFHYSVDVWIGFWMTYFVWSYYHEAIKASPFHRNWLMRFLTWLEAHATDLKYWRIRVADQFRMDQEMRDRSPQRNFLQVPHARAMSAIIVGAPNDSDASNALDAWNDP